MNCRHCKTLITHTFLDLGLAPLSNAYLSEADLLMTEPHYPLKIRVCDKCWLVQTEDYTEATQLFTPTYPYFSSTSTSWLAHAANYVKNITSELSLDQKSFVIEVASNDGYLLKNFVASSIPCLGIEPTASTASVAEKMGIPVLREFFSETIARQLVGADKAADLIVGNNVYAHVPNINDFTLGLKAVLKPRGIITLEFPHLMRLIENIQFDTVYHEHFSYLSLYTTNQIFEEAGLRVWRVEELSTHGGSLRVYGCHQNDSRKTEISVKNLLQEEEDRGLQSLDTYLQFQPNANKIRKILQNFLIEQKKAGKKVAAYGAAAKGNTLLNYAGIKPDLLPFVCDAASAKQGKYMPGSHIPICEPKVLKNIRPDYVLILPWNIATEIIEQNKFIRDWGGQFVTLIPRLVIQ